MYEKLLVLLIAAIVGVAACEAKDSEGDKSSTESEKTAASAEESPDESAEADDDPSAKESGESEDEAKAEPKSDQSFAGLSDQETFYVEITPEPNPIPFQELFELDIRVLDPEDKKTPMEGIQIDQVRATMPAHKHGMKVEPEIKETDDGVFKVEGMKFHMQGPGKHGRWVIEAVLNDGETVDKVSYDVQCCAE